MWKIIFDGRITVEEMQEVICYIVIKTELDLYFSRLRLCHVRVFYDHNIGVRLI